MKIAVVFWSQTGNTEIMANKIAEGALGGKKVALFGSYGWGDGKWMRDWVERCQSAGANLVGEGLILNGTPDADGEEQCVELGKQIAG